MLDSGEEDLDTGPAGETGPLPVILPPGFDGGEPGRTSEPAGTFAGFNRALRAKAGLEYCVRGCARVGGHGTEPQARGS